MNKKSLVSILLASVMSIGLMAGCGASKVIQKQMEEIKNI